MTRSVGLLGGTFDPVHVGHLDLADAARRALGLSQVTLVPAAVPSHRDAPVASASHRFAMAAMAALESECLTVSDIEIVAGTPSFTADTLDRLAATGTDLRSVVFITGADAFRDIASWKDYPAVLDRCHFAVVSRPDHPVSALRHALPALAGRMRETPCALPASPAILLVDAATRPVSSTTVRARVARGETIEGLVPASVARYIARQGLYGPAGGA